MATYRRDRTASALTMLYLAYGSNLLPRRLQARVPSARSVRTVRLVGWSLRFHKRGQDGSAKCDLLSTGNPADVAHGAIYRIDAAERPRLDHVEGLGRGYELDWLSLEGAVPVFLYRASSTHIDDRLKPFSWYREFVVRGAVHHGFPDAYVAAIAALDVLEDPDQPRHRHNRSILETNKPLLPVDRRARRR